MRAAMLMLAAGLATGGLAADGALAQGQGQGFLFSPIPRWSEEPETDVLCKEIRQECPALAAKGEIDTEIGFEELYDIKGQLVGVRLTQSTGCKPLDESELLGRRHFRLAFHKEGQPDLDDIHAEVAAGVDPGAVHIVKSSSTSLNIGCN